MSPPQMFKSSSHCQPGCLPGLQSVSSCPSSPRSLVCWFFRPACTAPMSCSPELVLSGLSLSSGATEGSREGVGMSTSCWVISKPAAGADQIEACIPKPKLRQSPQTSCFDLTYVVASEYFSVEGSLAPCCRCCYGCCCCGVVFTPDMLVRQIHVFQVSLVRQGAV